MKNSLLILCAHAINIIPIWMATVTPNLIHY